MTIPTRRCAITSARCRGCGGRSGSTKSPPSVSIMYKSLTAAVRDAEARNISLSQLALETESEDQGRPVGEIRDVLRRALHVMKGAVERGLVGDLKSASGLVGGDAAKLAGASGAPVAGTAFRDVLARALAVQE